MGNSVVAGLGPNERFIGVKGSRSQLNTPALLLDLDALERNIAAMARLTKAAGVNLRPHEKGAKSVEIARRQLAAGAIGVCCATLREAEVMADGGIENILVTSEAVTPAAIERAIALNTRSNGFILNVEDPKNLDALAAAAQKSGRAAVASRRVRRRPGSHRHCRRSKVSLRSRAR